jgi:hypothetical protein
MLLCVAGLISALQCLPLERQAVKLGSVGNYPTNSWIVTTPVWYRRISHTLNAYLLQQCGPLRVDKPSGLQSTAESERHLQYKPQTVLPTLRRKCCFLWLHYQVRLTSHYLPLRRMVKQVNTKHEGTWRKRSWPIKWTIPSSACTN